MLFNLVESLVSRTDPAVLRQQILNVSCKSLPMVLIIIWPAFLHIILFGSMKKCQVYFGSCVGSNKWLQQFFSFFYFERRQKVSDWFIEPPQSPDRLRFPGCRLKTLTMRPLTQKTFCVTSPSHKQERRRGGLNFMKGFQVKFNKNVYLFL